MSNALDRCRDIKATCDSIGTVTVPVRRADLALLIELADAVARQANNEDHLISFETLDALDALTTEDKP